jgi:peptide/nickel transport system permease protein
VLHRGFVPLVVTLGLGSWLIFARASYTECRRVLVLPYVEAARALGAGSWRLLGRHLLPNMSSALTVIASFTFADLVIAESGLSFLGLGAPPGVPSWGVMLADGRGYMETAWWLTVAPGVAIAFTVVVANFLGDALEVRFNPRRQR